MKKVAIWTAMLALVFGGTVYGYSISGGTRTDCPGKIICPIIGDEVCKDRCPLSDTARTDCPGKTKCPITGEEVCQDRCPLGNATSTKTLNRLCCRNAK